MSYIESACINIGQNMKRETFICLESTTYPTTTETFMLPIIERESGMKHGDDFWLAYSPERVEPGNVSFHTKNTPKVLGAINPEGLEIGKKIYAKAIETIHVVSSPRVAEMVKILENTYRLVNISLINKKELGIMGTRLQTYKFPEVIAGFEQNMDRVNRLLSGVYPAEKFEEAFVDFTAKDSTHSKIVLTFS